MTKEKLREIKLEVECSKYRHFNDVAITAIKDKVGTTYTIVVKYLLKQGLLVSYEDTKCNCFSFLNLKKYFKSKKSINKSFNV